MDNTSASSLLNDPDSVNLRIENDNVFKKIKKWLSRLSQPQISSIGIVGLTVLILPVALFLSQKSFNIRSRADVTTMPVTLPSEPTLTPIPTAVPGCQKTFVQGDLHSQIKIENLDPVFNGTQRLVVRWTEPSNWGVGCPNINGFHLTIGRGDPNYSVPLSNSNFIPFTTGSAPAYFALNVSEGGRYSTNVEASNDGGKLYGLKYSATIDVLIPTVTPSPVPISSPTPTPTKATTPTPTRQPSPTAIVSPPVPTPTMIPVNPKQPADPKAPKATPTPINYGQGNGSCTRTFGVKATCKNTSSCNGIVKSGYCPGPSTWKCCISR